MDNQHLRSIILKIQSCLNDNDRRRLQDFFDDNIPKRIPDDILCLIEYLFDQDKINEQDLICLINLFDEIQCTDGAKVLREHMKRVSSNESNKSTESLIPLIKSQDKESWVSQNGKCSNNNSMINSNSFTVVLDNHVSKRKQPFKMLPMTQICLLLCVLFAIILTGVVIDHCFQIMKLRNNYDHILNEQVKTSEIIQYLKAIQSKNEGDITSSKYNETTQELSTKEPIEEDQKFTEGFTCGCQQWCNEDGSSYGVCGNGHTCICGQTPITKENVGDLCTCDEWCRKHGHKNGGICGDGYTCICSS